MTKLLKNAYSLNLDFASPAFFYDESKLLKSVELINKIKDKTSCKILFPLKSFSVANALHFIASQIDGFAASSLYEAKLAKTIGENEKLVHLTTPGLKADEIEELSELCDYISFNSLSHWERYHTKVNSKVSCGLRVNPQLSFVKDDRYNPCRKYSKLGVPITQLSKVTSNGSNPLQGIQGLHFHTNCESSNFEHLLKTVKHIEAHLPKLLRQINWMNLGGGYLFEEGQKLDCLFETISILREKYDVDVFLEPGKGVVGKAGYIVSSVIDMFESDGKNIAVLDTTVNHMPEVFEYQYQPDIMQESENGKHDYILAGATCLAGDLFGEYSFDSPLEIGSRIVFENMGAYSMVKAHMFNGVNLPSIYAYTQEGKLELKKEFTYEDYLSKCGVNTNDLARKGN